MLDDKYLEGVLGVAELFDKGALCIVEGASENKQNTYAQTLLGAGKVHLEISVNEMLQFFKLFFEFPEEIKIFFNPLTKIIWNALSFLFSEHGLNINVFTKHFIFTGILKRVSFLNMDFKNYFDLLEDDHFEISRLFNSFGINSTKLFDFPTFYEEFKFEVIPRALKNKKNDKNLNIWVSSLGGWEETISFALVLYDYFRNNDIKKNYIIYSTDPIQIQTPNKIPIERLKKIPPHYHQYLDIKSKYFFIKGNVLSQIKFSVFNIYTKIASFGFDIVICRNILPFLKKENQEEIWDKMTTSLRGKGIFITEGSIELPLNLRGKFSEIGDSKKSFFELISLTTVSKFSKDDDIGKENDDPSEQELIRSSEINFIENTEDKVLSFEQEKELNYLEEIEILQKEIVLLKKSLKFASKSFKNIFSEQVKSIQSSQKDNKTLSLLNQKVSKMNKELENKNNQLEISKIQELEDHNFLKKLYDKVNSNKKDLEKEVEERTKELKKNQEEKSLFFAKLSHELRTPLNAVLGFSSILLGRLNKNNSIQDKKFLESINSSGKSLLGLVNTVHDFTKLDLNELKIVYKKMAIIKFFKDISLYYTNECMNKGIQYILELDDKLPHWIEGDEIRLKQVIDNILNNALKFTDDGHIKVVVKSKTSPQDKNIVNMVIQIMDTGRGINKEKLGQLFKIFSQVHDEASIKERGTGLGLYISKQIINKLGGGIRVESEVEKGTTFIIDLPKILVLSEERESSEVIYKFFGDTILIADDFPVNIELLEAYLSPYDLKVETAKNGEELVRKAKNSNSALIITDLKMPGLGGELALKELRRNDIKTPIILISALKVQDNIKKEFNSFLQKPIEEDIFIKEVSRFLKHKVEKKVVENNSEKFVEFLIPELLEEIEHSILLELKIELVKIKELMDMNLIEETSIKFKEKIKGTKLFSLSPWFEQLKHEGDYLNVSKIVLLLNKALVVLDKI